MKKIISLIIFSILLLAGCGGSADSGDDKLVVWSHFEGPIRPALEAWAAESGKEIEFVLIPWEDRQNKFSTALGTNQEPDIIIGGREDLGMYGSQGKLVAMDDVEEIASTDSYKKYLESTLPLTLEPGQYNGKNYGVGWEVPSTLFYYNTVVADECLGVSEPEDIEALMATPEDFYAIQDTMKEKCSDKFLLGDDNQFMWAWMDQRPMIDVATNEFKITEEWYEKLDDYKAAMDKGNFNYTFNEPESEVVGAKDHKFLGLVAPAWYTYKMAEYEQDGEWRIANPPFNTGDNGGSWIFITKSADNDLISDFLSKTILNSDYVVENMDTFNGVVPQQYVMDAFYAAGKNGESAVFGNQDISKKIMETAQEITEVVAANPYQTGVNNVLGEAIGGYLRTNTYATRDEVKEAIKSEILSLYPDTVFDY